MSRRRRVVLLAFLATLVVGGVIVVSVVRQAASPINPENFEQVRPKMTEQEVIAILGEPTEHGDGFLVWEGPRWVVIVYFDRAEGVSATMFGAQDSLLRRVQKWFGR